MSIENPSETIYDKADRSEKYENVFRIIASMKYVASQENPGNPQDKLRELRDYAEQLETAVTELEQREK